MKISKFQLATLKQTPKAGRPVSALILVVSLCFVFLAANAQSTQAATTNLVVNGSFEKDSNGDGVPNSWAPTGLTLADKRVCNQSYAGACSFRMEGNGGVKMIYQIIGVSGTASDEFTLSAWTKGKNIVEGGPSARVFVQFNTSAGPASLYTIYIPAGSSTWTLRQLTVPASLDYVSIYVGTQLFGTTSGKAWFDKFKLVPSP